MLWSKSLTCGIFPGNRPGTKLTGVLRAAGTVWTGEENLAPTGIRSPDPPVSGESQYRLNYNGPCIWLYCLLWYGHFNSPIKFLLVMHKYFRVTFRIPLCHMSCISDVQVTVHRDKLLSCRAFLTFGWPCIVINSYHVVHFWRSGDRATW